MNKILIALIVLIILSIIAIIIYLLYRYFRKRKIQNDINNYNNNIVIYDRKFNLNYYDNKYIDTSKFIKTQAVVISIATSINIIIYDDNIDLYKYVIMYDIDDYFNINDDKKPRFVDEFKDNKILYIEDSTNEKINLFDNKGDKFLFDKYDNDKIVLMDTYENNNYTIVKLNSILDKPNNRKIKVFSTILTKKELDIGDYLNVYYELNKNGGRITPPFLDNDYITFLNKK